MSFDLSVVTGNIPLFAAGSAVTLAVTLVSTVFGLLFGALFSVFTASSSKVARTASTALVALLRGFPFIILLFVVRYGLPFAGIRVSALVVGTIALSIYSGAYYSEVIRGGILAVPRGQFEAARVLGLSAWKTMLLVIAPQAARAALPPATNVTLSLLKDSAILSSITVPELTYQGLIVQGNTFAPFEVFAALTVIYWLMSFAIASVGRFTERRFNRSERGESRQSKLVASYLVLD